MTSQATQSSQHLAAAQELLDELEDVTKRADTDSQTKAVTAAAQSILVLAEQVAAIRVLMVEEAMSRRMNGQLAPANGQPAPAQPAPANAQPAPANGQPALQEKKTPKKRGWW